VGSIYKNTKPSKIDLNFEAPDWIGVPEKAWVPCFSRSIKQTIDTKPPIYFHHQQEALVLRSVCPLRVAQKRGLRRSRNQGFIVWASAGVAWRLCAGLGDAKAASFAWLTCQQTKRGRRSAHVRYLKGARRQSSWFNSLRADRTPMPRSHSHQNTKQGCIYSR
jgi:hypothetical protein